MNTILPAYSCPRNLPSDGASCPSLPAIVTRRPISYVSPSNDAQRRLARRLGAFVYSLNRAIYWRGISLNGLESRAVRSHARKCMKESALRAMAWRNFMLEDAGQD